VSTADDLSKEEAFGGGRGCLKGKVGI